MKITMADMPSGFWDGWIVVFTLVSLAGVAWLVLSLYFSEDAKAKPEVEPVWDTNIREGDHAPPMWWFFMLFGTMIFSLIYLMLFPGLGEYKGLLGWSQGGRVAESCAVFNVAFDATRLEIANTDLVILQNDLEMMAVAERIFTREYSACHGPEGRGQASVFPNLHDVDWQWGASVEQIEMSIRAGW
jgi:cytochrome c oxidase cbb3-type subunit 3